MQSSIFLIISVESKSVIKQSFIMVENTPDAVSSYSLDKKITPVNIFLEVTNYCIM